MSEVHPELQLTERRSTYLVPPILSDLYPSIMLSFNLSAEQPPHSTAEPMPGDNNYSEDHLDEVPALVESNMDVGTISIPALQGDK